MTCSALDQQFSALLLRRHQHPLVAQAATLVSQAVGGGHVCVYLPEFANTEGLPEWPVWRALLQQSPWIGTPTTSTGLPREKGADAPLILDQQGRLYLARYWHYEQSVAAQLRRRAASSALEITAEQVRAVLTPLFPANAGIDWQKIACANALAGCCSVISGGPGTGKTTTVVKLLAAWLQLAPQRSRLLLAAPTGKAASRLAESIRVQRQALSIPPELAARLPEQAVTLHRLLGVVADSVYFRHHGGRPLPVDLLVVDEASMIGTALMAKLLDALPTSAVLVLLGDHQQLCSVESGAVFGDLCAHLGYDAPRQHWLEAATGATLPPTSTPPPAFANAVTTLHVSHRFQAGHGIGRLANLINQGRAVAAAELIRQGNDAELGGWLDAVTPQRWQSRMLEGYAEYWVTVRATGATAGSAAADNLNTLFTRFAQFRVLAALRDGPCGANGLNEQLERAWRDLGQIGHDRAWYIGRPVMITGNDYGLQLYNGDIGLTLETTDGLRVFFLGEGGARHFAPARLPAHQTAWASTVHKAQGSEFDQVLLVLPESPSAVLSRALIYTAVTRARHRVEVWGPQDVWEQAINTVPLRHSGLRDLLAAPC